MTKYNHSGPGDAKAKAALRRGILKNREIDRGPIYEDNQRTRATRKSPAHLNWLAVEREWERVHP